MGRRSDPSPAVSAEVIADGSTICRAEPATLLTQPTTQSTHVPAPGTKPIVLLHRISLFFVLNYVGCVHMAGRAAFSASKLRRLPRVLPSGAVSISSNHSPSPLPPACRAVVAAVTARRRAAPRRGVARARTSRFTRWIWAPRAPSPPVSALVAHAGATSPPVAVPPRVATWRAGNACGPSPPCADLL